MARVTVEDCLRNVDNRFGLVMIGVKRTKQLFAGADPLVECDNREIITSLREIAANIVKPVGAINIEEDFEPSKLVPVTLKDPDDL